MKITSFLLFLLLPALFLKCEDDDWSSKPPIEQLPPITQTGEDTFGCLINGEAMYTSGYKSDESAEYVENQGLIIYGSTDKKGIDTGISIILLEPFTVGQVYNFTNHPQTTVRFIRSIKEQSTCYYDFGQAISGSVTISKLDFPNRIVAGTFDFTIVNETCDTIKVTNGRFDIELSHTVHIPQPQPPAPQPPQPTPN